MSQRVQRGFRGERFRELREAAGMTMTDLARLSDLSPSTISSWERGSAAPDVARLVQVASVLGVDVSELVNVDASAQMPSDLRVRKGLSQIELARATGLSTAVTGAFERAEVAWKDKHATKIAAALDVSIEELRQAWERARRRPPGTPA